ncbi:MAG: fibrobacter succinogenes major paralogous domain-containing protein [Bacteroidota bacterium]|nr:fibrobacter succinogenes major paralogous domain-containing protein [Bacteroidota bacterium]
MQLQLEIKIMKKKIEIRMLLLIVIMTGVLSMLTIGCRKDNKIIEPATLPVLTTGNVTNITQSSAQSGGEITSDGGARITVSGVCWSTKHNPTFADSKTTNGPTIGDFTSSIENLSIATTYYVRAYATNDAGTAYDHEVSFTTTAPIATVTTTEVSDVTATTATSGGKITSYGTTVTARGVCWSSTNVPTIADFKTTDGDGGDAFTSNITGLTPGKTYRVRAYTINSGGTAYGNMISFTTTPPTVTDFDGNVYHEITIGTQTWMKENLRVTHFRNGDPIPDLFNLNAGYIAIYGQLYTGFAAIAPRNIAPTGWHVPTREDWKILELYIAGNAGKLKEEGTTHWHSPNTGATNETGFTALPGGLDQGGGVAAIGDLGFWWTSSPANATDLWRRAMTNGDADLYLANNDKALGFSIRLVKD